jgi:diazepam-binding inhibitor (GABA receptor modulator, acyl-CoA-binding protein)
MSLTEDFQKSIVHLKKLMEKPSNTDLLHLYALYKQVMEGDIKRERPQSFDFKAIAKYEAWSALKGKNEKECMQEYIRKVDALTKA